MTSWTNPQTWADGNEIAASELNTYVRDNPLYLYEQLQGTSFYGVRVDRNGVAQSISNTTLTDVSFTRELIDVGSWISVTATSGTVPAAAFPSGITSIVVAGYFRAEFAANSTGVRKAYLQRTGSNFAVSAVSAASADTTDLTGFGFTTFTSGDTFKLVVYQSSGGALDLQTVEVGLWRIGIIAA